MRNLLGTLALLAIILAVVGFSRNWFAVSQKTAGSDTELHIQIDRARISKDTKNAAKVAREIKDNIEKKIVERQDKKLESTR